MSKLVAPFPYFGGKSKAAKLVWQRFGEVKNYVEPFFGSGAVLLARPRPFDGVETVNDIDGLICNFWRSVKSDPEGVVRNADWPCIENDLHARHAWLVNQRKSLQSALEGDPDYYDTKSAGWWLWGACLWIASDWCSGRGPWNVVENEDGSKRLAKIGKCSDGNGIRRKRPHLGTKGMGINKKFDCEYSCDWLEYVTSMISDIRDRVRHVRICCGNWDRVCGHTPTINMGLTGIFLDPPYADSEETKRYNELYGIDSKSISKEVRKWALEHGENKKMRICLAGLEGEHEMPDSWECVNWTGHCGYSLVYKDKSETTSVKERLWFSPNCVRDRFPLWGE